MTRRRVLIGVALLVVTTGGTALTSSCAPGDAGDPERSTYASAARSTTPTATVSPSAAAQPSTSADPSGVPSSSRAPDTAGQRAEVESWVRKTSRLFALVPLTGSTVRSGRLDPMASDGRALALTIPAKAQATPAHAAEVESKKPYRYGSFSSRVRTADCSSQPDTGAVTGIFTYANDGSDRDGDGITDNGELDIEILCARPWEVHLAIWTDYRDSDEAQSRVFRQVDLRTGEVSPTCYKTSFDDTCGAVSAAESSPASVAASPGFDSSTAYYDYRIDWAADRVVFSISVGGRELTLWDYQGPSDRIPHVGASFMVNLWHTANWTPPGLDSATEAPTTRLTAWVDTSTITSRR